MAIRKVVDIPTETRAASVGTADPEKRTFVVTFTTGAGVERMNWWTGERYLEELVVSDKAIKMERLNSGAPFLDSHRVYGGVNAQLGVVERAWVEGGEGRAEIRFPKPGVDADADAVFAKIADGILRSVSVGYIRNKIEVDKKKEPNVWRVIEWTPHEISLVTVPADHKAQVRNHGDAAPCEFLIRPNPGFAAAAKARMAARLRHVTR